MNTVIESHDAHATMAAQALNSPVLRAAMLDILLNDGKLYEALREREAG